MSDVFPTPERPEDPEEGQPVEPQDEDETMQAPIEGRPSEEDAWAPLSPEESAAETILTGEPLEPASVEAASTSGEEFVPEPAFSEEEPTLMAEGPASESQAEEVPPASEAGASAEEAAQEAISEPTPPPAGGSAPPLGPVPPVGEAQQPLSPEDERLWSMLSHLSMLLNLVTGILGPLAALLIYLVYKDRSKKVAFHAMQSMVFQLVTWVGGGLLIGAIWVITGLLSAVIIGLLCIPFAALLTIPLAALPIVGVIYSIVAAIQVNSNQPFSYWLVGDWVRGMLD